MRQSRGPNVLLKPCRCSWSTSAAAEQSAHLRRSKKHSVAVANTHTHTEHGPQQTHRRRRSKPTTHTHTSPKQKTQRRRSKHTHTTPTRTGTHTSMQQTLCLTHPAARVQALATNQRGGVAPRASTMANMRGRTLGIEGPARSCASMSCRVEASLFNRRGKSRGYLNSKTPFR
jgi:hypothetical protein